MRRFLAVMIAALALAPSPGRPEAQPMPLPTDNRLVVFSYDANQTYPILTLPGTVTDIQLHEDERLTHAAIGDSVQWQTSAAGNHFFVKPVKHDIFTSLTLVTDKRAYQISLIASPKGGKWYQRVSWRYPELVVAAEQEEKKKAEREAREAERLEALKASEPLDPSSLNFDYRISGEESIRPSLVMDDGARTWIRMPKGTQELPALFVYEGDKATLTNFSVRGDYLVVQRTAGKFLLRLGNREAVIERTSKGLFSLF